MNSPGEGVTPRQRAFVLFELMNQMVLVAQEAKSRGYQIVVLNHDPLRAAGAFAVPDGLVDELIYVESWSDAAAVRTIVDGLSERHDVVGTYAGFEHTLAFEAELRQRVGLPHNGVDDTLRALDKAQVRRKFYTECLSNLRSASLSEALRWDSWQFKGPAVVKPANGIGSALCFIVSSLDELRDAAAKADAESVINPLMREYIGANGEFVLEEKAEGELLSVESLVCRGKVHHVGLTGRYQLAADPVVEQGLFFPHSHPRTDEIVASCELFHKSLNIFHGPTHVEVMVPADGPIELIEFNLRFAGFAATVLVSEAFGLRFETLLTDIACGLEPDTTPLTQPSRFAADLLVMPPPGVTEFRDLVFPPGSTTQRLTKELGQRLTGRSDQLDSVAMFVVSGDTAAQTHAKALEARQLTVFNGEPIGDNPATRVTFGGFADQEANQN